MAYAGGAAGSAAAGAAAGFSPFDSAGFGEFDFEYDFLFNPATGKGEEEGKDGDGEGTDPALYKWIILSCPSDDCMWEKPVSGIRHNDSHPSWKLAATHRGSFSHKGAPTTGWTPAWCSLTTRTATRRPDKSRRRSRPPRPGNRPSTTSRRSTTVTTRPCSRLCRFHGLKRGAASSPSCSFLMRLRACSLALAAVNDVGLYLGGVLPCGR